MFRPRRRVLAGTICIIAAAAAVAATGLPAAQASTACPATFQVLHNDRIGSLQLPAGKYQLRVSSVSCARAASLFTVFLNDYDGRLPSGWKATARARGQGLFTQGANSFAVSLKSTSGGGGNGGLVCSTPYKVATSTQAGLLALPAGSYQLTRLSAISPTCAQSASLLTSFLGLTQQVLPGAWISLFADGAFVQNSATYGFRLEPLA